MIGKRDPKRGKGIQRQASVAVAAESILLEDLKTGLVAIIKWKCWEESILPIRTNSSRKMPMEA